MSISSVSSATTSSQPATQTDQAKKRNTLNQEDFINLLVTQLRFQDPLNPIDNNQMAAQMAQFSSLESLGKINDSLNAMAANQASTSNVLLAGLIGKKIEAVGSQLSIDQGNVSEGCYQLSQRGKVTMRIYDALGQLVRTIDEGVKEPSKQKLIWDGKSAQGTSLPDGTYAFQVSAVDEKGQAIPVSVSTLGTVTGISFENGMTYLKLGARKVTMGDILSIL
jgi:flagellar basal-body rod modification protein FlgD